MDKVEIQVRAGDGGKGAVSFRHEKFAPLGEPDGGDGGKGADVYVVVDSAVNTLYHFRNKRRFRAGNGGNGAGQDRHGKNGGDILIKVPLGTELYRKENRNKLFLADLKVDGERLLVAKGGMGGYGNVHFSSPTNRTPRIAEKGQPGEQIILILNLKLIADVGIIGYPNVGKSTLLASASAAKPEIADYPFTTRRPVLGVVEVGWKSFIMAEIPGLIKGAHRGRGLGYEFLRHAERTRLFIHLLDGTSSSLESDFRKVNDELVRYSPALLQKPQIVGVNKVDLPEVRARVSYLKGQLSALNSPVFFISAVTKEGIARLMAKVAETLDSIAKLEKQGGEALEMVFRPRPKYYQPAVSKEDGVFVVSAPDLERLIARTDIDNAEGRQHLKRQFARLGVTKALRKAGIEAGDRVRLGEIEVEWD